MISLYGLFRTSLRSPLCGVLRLHSCSAAARNLDTINTAQLFAGTHAPTQQTSHPAPVHSLNTSGSVQVWGVAPHNGHYSYAPGVWSKWGEAVKKARLLSGEVGREKLTRVVDELEQVSQTINPQGWTKSTGFDFRFPCWQRRIRLCQKRNGPNCRPAFGLTLRLVGTA